MLIALLAVLGVDLIVAVIGVRMDGATVEIAANSTDTELLLGPYRKEVA